MDQVLELKNLSIIPIIMPDGETPAITDHFIFGK